MRSLHLVRAMKSHSWQAVSNAMSACGWHFKKPGRHSKNVEIMVRGIPRSELERILKELTK